MPGRFDALTQLDKQPEKTLPSPEKPANPQAGKPTNPHVHKPASPQVGKPVRLQNHETAKNPLGSDDRDKYTTRLRPSMVKFIKIFAAQQDIKDYEVVEKALLEYFEKNK